VAIERRTLRRAGIALAACLLGFAACVAWWLRDPEPVFVRRTGSIVSVDSGARVRDGAMEEQEIRLASSTGMRLTLAVRGPAAGVVGPSGDDSGAVVPKRQTFLVLGGYERGRGASALITDTRGTIFASLDYPYDGDLKAKGLAVVAQVPAIRRAFYDTPPAVSLAIDYLLSRPDVDPERLELVGASFGAPFATIAAARDQRVRRLWLAHGGGHPFAMIDTGLVREIPFAPLRWPVSALATVLASGPRLAPEHWVGRVSPRPVVMLNATDDERIPRRSVDALWAATHEPREQVWLPGRHMQGDRPDVLRALVDSVMARAVRPTPR
jgi:dienelactone hydrolase